MVFLLYMVEYSISSLYLPGSSVCDDPPGSSVCDDPGKYKQKKKKKKKEKNLISYNKLLCYKPIHECLFYFHFNQEIS